MFPKHRTDGAVRSFHFSDNLFAGSTQRGCLIFDLRAGSHRSETYLKGDNVVTQGSFLFFFFCLFFFVLGFFKILSLIWLISPYFLILLSFVQYPSQETKWRLGILGTQFAFMISEKQHLLSLNTLSLMNNRMFMFEE